MSFSFFRTSRPKTTQEVVKATKESLMVLDIKTVVEVTAREKAMKEIKSSFVIKRCKLSGNGEVEPNVEQVLQLAADVFKEDVLALLVP